MLFRKKLLNIRITYIKIYYKKTTTKIQFKIQKIFLQEHYTKIEL